MRVMLPENVVDHAFLRDVIGSGNDKMLHMVAAQQLSGGTVCDTAEHFAQLLQCYNVGIIPINLISTTSSSAPEKVVVEVTVYAFSNPFE